MLHEKNCRYMVLMTLVAILTGFLTPAYAFQGGPDKYGYRYIDSMEKTGPRFTWQKIGKDRVQLEGKTKVGDNLTAPYPIGFSFEFYGKKYRSFYISDNGYIVFPEPNTSYRGYAYNGQSVPSTSEPNHMLAPLWGDNSGVA